MHHSAGKSPELAAEVVMIARLASGAPAYDPCLSHPRHRHARPWRLSRRSKDVDARHKAGHDHSTRSHSAL